MGRGGNWHTISGKRGRVGVPVLPKNCNQKECVMRRGQGDRKQLSNCKLHGLETSDERNLYLSKRTKYVGMIEALNW